MPAPELQVLAGGGVAGPLTELAARFAAASGHKPVLRFGTSPQLIAMATGADPYDLGVFPADVLEDAAARSCFGPPVGFARAGLAIAVRAGAARPDIGTPEALKRTLLAVRSIASIPASATGKQLARVFDALGISAAMAASIKPQATPAAIIEAVASGECELALFLQNVLTAPGLDVVGFPPALQRQVVFVAAVAAKARDVAAATAFMDFLSAPAARELLQAKGLMPG